MLTFDVLIVGSGLAGMTLALHLAEHKRVALVTKKDYLFIEHFIKGFA